MLYLIVGIVFICVIIWLVKKIGGIALTLLKSILTFIIKVIHFITAGPAILCSKVFYKITKILHAQSFAYYLIGVCSIPSFIYLCTVHIPYSKKEKFLNSKEFFALQKKTRYENIAMSSFLTFEGLLFICLPLIREMKEDDVYGFCFLGFIYIISAFIYIFIKLSKWKKENKSIYDHYMEWGKWVNKESPLISEVEIEEKLISASVNFAEADSNKKKFMVDEMPYGRATAFISYFEKNLDDEEPVYFSPEMSSDENELREYGTLVTTKGVYISKYGKDDIEIPFEGLWNITNDETNYIFDYGLLYGEPKVISVEKTASSIDLDILKAKLMDLNDINLAMAQEKVVTELD